MKKKARIISLLREGYSPREIAAEVPCSPSYAYHVRDRENLGSIKNQVARLYDLVAEIHELLVHRVLGQPEIIDRLTK